MSWTEIPNPQDATFKNFYKDPNSTTIVATDVSNNNVYYSVAGGAWTVIGASPEGTGYYFYYNDNYFTTCLKRTSLCGTLPGCGRCRTARSCCTTCCWSGTRGCA